MNALTFKDIVINDKSSDVIVLFYVKHCEFCDQLWPIFIEVAEKLKKTNKLVFAAIDMGENEIDILQQSMQISVYYYP